MLFKDYLNEKLENPEFRAAYDALGRKDLWNSINNGTLKEVIYFKFGLVNSLNILGKASSPDSFFNPLDLEEIKESDEMKVYYGVYKREPLDILPEKVNKIGHNNFYQSEVKNHLKEAADNLILFIQKFSEKNGNNIFSNSLYNSKQFLNVICNMRILKEIHAIEGEKRILEPMKFTVSKLYEAISKGLFGEIKSLVMGDNGVWYPENAESIPKKTEKSMTIGELKEWAEKSPNQKILFSDRYKFDLLGKAYNNKDVPQNGCNAFALCRRALDDIKSLEFGITFYHELAHCLFSHNRQYKKLGEFYSVKHRQEQEAQRYSSVFVLNDGYKEELFKFSQKQPFIYKIQNIDDLMGNLQ